MDRTDVGDQSAAQVGSTFPSIFYLVCCFSEIQGCALGENGLLKAVRDIIKDFQCPGSCHFIFLNGQEQGERILHLHKYVTSDLWFWSPPSSFPLPGAGSFLLHSVSSSTEIRPFGFLFCRAKKENTLHKYFNSLWRIKLEELHYPSWFVAASCFATEFIEVEQSSSSKRWKLSEFCMFLSDVEVLKGPVLIYIALLKISE